MRPEQPPKEPGLALALAYDHYEAWVEGHRIGKPIPVVPLDVIEALAGRCHRRADDARAESVGTRRLLWKGRDVIMRDPLSSPLVPSRRWKTSGELIAAALAYIYACTDAERGNNLWPFEPEAFQPTWPVDNLVKARALITAEIERLQNLPPKSAREIAHELRAGTFRP